MIQTLKQLFGIGPAVDYAELLKNGAQLIDVRSRAEYQEGHIKGSLNLPLNTLAQHAHRLSKDVPVITCCASGVRSAQAKNILKQNGFKEVHNGGGWMSLQNKLKK